ncbi:MAG: hypothetical protein EZS28_014916 [Streblomastix strix]|uniref:Uncharacterized protein n=1 Tax=Streblomastix strix TaxID=222440 RepID=A0A5J4W4N8_9EUKA|nr:MAG: hypothetical protein EZS28_014916 [Streblomastix strix]
MPASLIQIHAYSMEPQLGCDAYLEYNSPSADWINVKEIEKSVLVMFEGSTTNAGNGSVSFFVYREEGNITGYVTLPEPVIPKSNKGVVVGIVIGILVLIAAIVTIGVIVFVVYRKQNQDKKGASSIEQSNPIIDETYLSA